MPAAAFPEKIGFCFHDVPPGSRVVALAKRAEELGYSSLWAAETRLTRDAISVLGALAASTERVQLGSSIVNTWTRGPVLMALTFISLHGLAPGRVSLGLGAYSDPLASNQGVERRKPVTQMREYVDVVRRLFRNETITFDGEVVRITDVTLDLTRGEERQPIDVPVYIGATGDKMLDLAGEIADGVVLNGFLPASYTSRAIERVRAAAAEAGRDASALHFPQLLAVAVSEDGETARATAKTFVTIYLGGQPHIAHAIGLDPELVERLTALIGSWPPKPGGLEEAMGLVGMETVNSLVVSGTAAEARERIGEWVEAGADYPIITPLTENAEAVCEALAPGSGSL
ncbi:MAG: 5,10-methylenetetrahydromethanopterin reductase [Gaiellaceae bacterium]|jgi:5,10-methylenetetrahydromethanopterin reductase|nr:5,10-methylenetetrahydromethanopterin reductase [Gaiellaceae bacterium]